MSAVTLAPEGKAHRPIHIYLYAPARRRRRSTLKRRHAEARRGRGWRALRRHVAVGAAVSEGAALFLEGDEVPHSDHGVVRHVEVKQLHAGEGLEGAQLARRSGEVLGDEKAICGRKQRSARCGGAASTGLAGPAGSRC